MLKTKTKQYCWLYHFGRGKDHIVAILGTSTNQKKKTDFLTQKNLKNLKLQNPPKKITTTWR